MVLPMEPEYERPAAEAQAPQEQAVTAGTQRPAATIVPGDLPPGEEPPEDDAPVSDEELREAELAAGDTLLALPEAEDDGPHGEELIQPRQLSPEFARRIAAGWKATRAHFKDAKDTLKFEPKTKGGSRRDSGSGSGSGSGAAAGSASRGDSGSGGSSDGGVGDLGELIIGSRDVRGVEEPGEKDYELKEIIGQGAMGVVWLARQASLNRDVAIKMPKEKVSKSGSGRRQFMAEVVVTGQLDHPNIVPIYDLAKDASGQLFYSMKQVQGRPWNEILEEKSQKLHDSLEILMKVCDAIRFAHDRGVIHRDIKPHNVMVGTYGEVSVMDWGIALRLDIDGAGGGVTRISPAGTPAYMAPEMATGNAGEIGPATDVYLLGAVLYEIITGDPPHPPPTDSHNRLELVNDALLIAARNDITPIEGGGELAEIAYRAMATDVENRYQKVDEFQTAIREYLSHAESIKLTKRGEETLIRAKRNGKAKGDQGGRFDDFDRARFAFEESIAIWPGNRVAQARLDETLIAYANYAHEEGAYARGIALLSDSNSKHKSLLRKLRAARRRTESMSMLLKAAVMLIIVGTSIFSLFLYRSWQATDLARVAAVEAEEDAKANEAEAKRQEGLAKQSAAEALRQKENAEKQEAEALKQKENAEKQEAEALKQKDLAEKQEAEALRQKENAEKQEAEALRQAKIAESNAAEAEAASYAFEIGLAAEELQRNAFSRVQNILQTQTQSPAKSPLRNWEWGYLNALVNLENQEYDDRGRLLQGRVETAAISPDRAWVAAGTGSGDVYLWPFGGAEQPVRLRYGEEASAVAFSPDGKTLLAAGRVSDGRYSVKAWSLPARDGAEPDREIVSHEAAILSLDVAGEFPTVLSAAADGVVRLTSLSGANSSGTRGSAKIQATSQENAIWSARFSPDGAWIVTAGEDGAVKVWNTREVTGANGAIVESLRLDEHDGPVYTAEFSPDGRYIVSGGRDRRLLATPFDPSAASRSEFSRRRAVEDRLTSVSNTLSQSSKSILLGEHDAAVRRLDFSGEGNLLFSGGNDHTVRVWDLADGFGEATLAKTLRGHGGWVRAVVAVPGDPNRVLSAGYDRRVKNWNLENYAFPEVLKHASNRQLADSELTASAVSPNGEWVAAAASSGVITMWDMQNADKPKASELAEGHDWQATTGVYFAGGKKLLTAGGDNTALVWDEARGNEIVRMGGWNQPVGAGWRGVAAASSDGRWVATGADGEDLARLWDAETGELVASILTPAARSGGARSQAEGPEATALAFSPDGQQLVIGDQWGTAYVSTPTGGWRAKAFAAHEGKITALHFLSSGDALLSASTDGTVQEWSVDSGEPQSQKTFRHDDRVVAMDLSVDGEMIITAVGSSGASSRAAGDAQPVLLMWDRANADRPTRTLGLADVTGKRATPGEKSPMVRSVALHPSDPVALVSVFDPQTSTYRIGRWSWMKERGAYRPVSNRLLRDVSTALYPPHRSGSILTVGGRGARRQTVGPRTTTVAMSYRPQASINSISFSADNSRMVSASEDGSLKVWTLDGESRQWKPDARLVGQHQKAVNSVKFHPTRSDLFLTASDDGTAKLWTLRDGAWEAGQTLTAPGGEQGAGPVEQAVFVPTTAEVLRIATAGDAGAFLWEGAAAPVRLGAEGAACCIAASPEGKWVVVATGAQATVYNAATGQPLSTPLQGHSADITGLAFTSDGTRLFTTSRDTTVKLWDTQALAAGAAEEKKLEADRELLTLEGHSDEVTSITVADIGKHPFVMTTGLDGQAILWPNRAEK